MAKDFWQLIGFTLIGLVPWLAGYMLQKMGGGRSIIIRPPRWIVWLCGNPRNNGQIDLGYGGMQLVGLVPLVGGPLCIALGLEFRLRLVVVTSVYVLVIVLWLIVEGLVNMRHQR